MIPGHFNQLYLCNVCHTKILHLTNKARIGYSSIYFNIVLNKMLFINTLPLIADIQWLLKLKLTALHLK